MIPTLLFAGLVLGGALFRRQRLLQTAVLVGGVAWSLALFTTTDANVNGSDLVAGLIVGIANLGIGALVGRAVMRVGVESRARE